MGRGGHRDAGRGELELSAGRARLGRAAAVAFYADGLLLLVSLAAVPFLVRRLGTEPYGILGVISVLAGQLGVLHLGVGAAATRLISQGRGASDERAVADAVAGSLAVGALAALAVGSVFAVVAPRAWTDAFSISAGALPTALAAVPAAVVQVALTPAIAAMYGLLFGRELFYARTLLYGFQGIGRLVVAVAVVAGGGGVVGVLWAFAATDLVTLIVGLAIALRGIPLGAARGSMARAVAPVLKVGVPFALGSIPAALLVDVEKLVLGVRVSVDAFAYYSVPYNGVLRLSLIGAAVGTVLLPRVTAEMAAGATHEALRLTRAATRLLAATMMVVLIPLIAIAPELLHFWVGAEFASRSSLAARLLMVSIFGNVLARPPLAVIQGRAHPSTLVWVYAGELLIHVPLTLFLVGRFGITGAGAAWGARALIDAGVLRALAGRTLASPVGEERVMWGGTATLGALVVLVTLVAIPAPLRVLGGGAAAAVAFFLLLDRAERSTLIDSLMVRARGEAAITPAATGQVGVPDPEEPEASL